MQMKVCKICGGAIVCTYQREDLYFYIEDGKVKRDTNPDLWAGYPFVFHCSNDREHPIVLDSSWCDEFEKEISKMIVEVKLNV